MKRPGILLLNTSSIYGGTEKWMLMTGEQLQKKGFFILIGYRYQIIKQNAHTRNLRTVKIPVVNETDLYSLFYIILLILKFNLQLVIPTKAKEYFLVTFAAKLICRKSLIRLGIVRNIKSTLKNRLLYGKMADGILVNNDAIKDTLSQSKFINQNKIHVIYNGVESVENIPSFEKDPNPFIFIYIGSLINRKNVSKLVQIFHKLVKQENNKLTELWLVGDGPERTTLEKLCKKLEIENQVRFMGHQTNVLSFLGSAHTMVLLSENEGFPNAALESMVNGVPVILGQTAETANVIENDSSGLLVNLNKETEILNAMKLLLHNHKKRLQLRSVALEKIRSQFSISAMTEKTDQLIRKMINV